MRTPALPRPLVRILAVVIAFNAVMALVALALRRVIPSSGDETSDEIALAAAGNGIDLRSRATAFRGGSARAIMGGLALDLRQATLAPEGGRLEVQAIMGGVEILVPPSWSLRVNPAHVVMGGIDHPRRVMQAGPDERPVLELSMLAVMGGIEIKAKAPEERPAAADAIEIG